MILNYLTQKQALDYWCWAAVASSVSFFYNKNQQGLLQGQIGGSLIGSICGNISTTNNKVVDPSCNTPRDISNALKITGNLAWDVNRALTFNEVVGQINAAFPICCQIYWPINNHSHFVAIYGYQNNNVIIGDPESGVCTLDFNDFLSYRQGQWIRSVGTQQAS
jgi:Papain-like cysteine protease AvrRpt2